MAREQGDEMSDEVVYVHPERDGERRASTPADHVNLQARGWVRRDDQRKTSGRKATTPAVGKGAAGNGESEHA